MGSIHHLYALDDQPPPNDARPDSAWGDLELPGWQEFTTARDRFFASLRSAAELYRNGEIATDDGEPRGEDRA